MKSFLKILIILLCFLTALELSVRLLSLDLKILRHTLFYSAYHVKTHQVDTSTPHLHYRPRPGVYSEPLALHSLEKAKQKKINNISVNPLGFRSPNYKAKKKNDVFRILVFGGSNTYGISVDDNHTYPQQLNQLFFKNQKHNGVSVEVWNGGITASVMSQKVAFARSVITKLSPDLIIFQGFMNYGRKPFLMNSTDTSSGYGMEKKQVPSFSDARLEELFSLNHELYLENIPFLHFKSQKVLEIHQALVSYFASYRLLQALWLKLYTKFSYPNHQKYDCIDQREKCDDLDKRYSIYAETVNERELNNFLNEKEEKLRVIIFDPFQKKYCNKDNEQKNVYHFSLRCEGDYPAEFLEAHPPSYVYKYYAEQLYEFISKQKMIATALAQR